MGVTEELIVCFQELNINISEGIIKKCVDICTKYNVDPEEFVDQWIASTLTKKWDSNPTLDNLEKFERTDYFKQLKELPVTPKPRKTIVEDEIEPTNKPPDLKYTTPKRLITTKEVSTPEPKSFRSTENDNTLAESPSVNNVSSQAGTYSDRTDSRSVKCSYGPETNYRNESNTTVCIRLNNKDSLTSGARYMYSVLTRISDVLNYLTKWIGSYIFNNEVKQENNDLETFTSATNMGQIVTYGRISSDDGGRLNVQSVILEETLELSYGHTTKLILNKLKDYSLFPGQVVVVQGNSTRSGLVAEKIYANATLQLPTELPNINENLQIIVAAGPFSLRDNLKFEPLQDLIKYVLEHKPHVVILMGPFVEMTPESALNVQQDFATFFEEQIIDGLQSAFANSDIKIVIMASHKEAHLHNIFPTPPYKVRENKSNIIFVPDPCTLNINGLIISATNTDILFHLGKEELYRSTSESVDRLSRLSSYLLKQQNFYPLHPPHEDLLIDYTLFEQNAVMDCLPHMLILPSTFRYFVKDVNNCLVINPERLTKGFVAGTFARIQVRPGTSNNICSRASCEILRI